MVLITCTVYGVDETPDPFAVTYCVVLVDAAGHQGPAACAASIPVIDLAPS